MLRCIHEIVRPFNSILTHAYVKLSRIFKIAAGVGSKHIYRNEKSIINTRKKIEEIKCSCVGR